MRACGALPCCVDFPKELPCLMERRGRAIATWSQEPCSQQEPNTQARRDFAEASLAKALSAVTKQLEQGHDRDVGPNPHPVQRAAWQLV